MISLYYNHKSVIIKKIDRKSRENIEKREKNGIIKKRKGKNMQGNNSKKKRKKNKGRKNFGI